MGCYLQFCIRKSALLPHAKGLTNSLVTANACYTGSRGCLFFLFMFVGLCLTLSSVLGFAFSERLRQATPVLRTLSADSSFTIGPTNQQPGAVENEFSVFTLRERSKDVSGEEDSFKEWSFSVDLALRSHVITQGQSQVDLEMKPKDWFRST